MDTEVFVPGQLGEHGVRDRADAHLQAGAVLDQRGAVLADRRFGLVRGREVSLFERLVVLYEQVDVVNVDERVSERARNVFIDDGDHRTGALDGGQRGVDRSAQRYVAVRVRGRYLNHRHVARQRAAAVQFLGFAEEYRDVVGVARLGHLADVAAYEKRVELENAFELRSRVGSGPFGVQMVHVHVFEFFVASAVAHGVDQALRRAGHAAQVNVIAGFDHFHRFGGRNEFDLFGHYKLS